MIAFWTISALFVAGALLLVVPPLLTQRERTGSSRSATNLAIHRDELRELDAAKRAGTLDAKQYASARRELEARVLEDVAQSELAPAARRGARATALGAGLAIPLFAFALYFGVGNPQAITAGQAGAAHGYSPQQVEALLERLATRMKASPEDPEGWMLLGRSYGALGRFGEAAQAYANAAARRPDDASLLADYADALAMARGGLQGEPEALLARSLEVDPRNVKALALAGTAAFEKKDYAAAVRNWERIVPLLPPESESARATLASIAEARSLGGLKAEEAATKAR